MGECDAPTREWDTDLTCVHVSGEDQAEGRRRDALDDARKVTEEQVEGGAGVVEMMRPGAPSLVALRVDADDGDVLAAQCDQLRLVVQQSRVLEVA
jgi:hypothetical protein